MLKIFIYAAVAVTSVLMAYNAVADQTFPVDSIAIASTDLRTSNAFNVATKFIQVVPIESTVPARGITESNAVEASSVSDLSSINTVLKKSNWKYMAQIIESGPYALQPGTYKAELFENGKSKGVLFFKQTESNGVIEGVTATWDIGNDVPLNAVYTIKVTKLSTTQGSAAPSQDSLTGVKYG